MADSTEPTPPPDPPLPTTDRADSPRDRQPDETDEAATSAFTAKPFRGGVRVSVVFLIAGVMVYAARVVVGTVARVSIDRGEGPGAIGLAHEMLQLTTIALGLALLTVGLLLVDTSRRVLGVVCALAGLVGGQQLCVMFFLRTVARWVRTVMAWRDRMLYPNAWPAATN